MNNALATYLQDVIGVSLAPAGSVLHSERLPYFITDTFDLADATIEGFPVTLATPRQNLGQRLDETVQQLKQLRERLGKPVIFCPATLASYERRNLIRYRMPFIVPGKQMYLPHLGIDLRERVLQKPVTVARLTPSSQALLIWSLLNLPTQEEWEPAIAAAALGYTPMAASRAARELEATGLMTARMNGRIKCLQRMGAAPEIWERAKPFLQTPVLREHWIQKNALQLPDQVHLRKAGITALTAQTLLAEDLEDQCFAIPQRQWLARPKQLQPLDYYEQGAIRLQIWSYETAICAKKDWVDPLSLSLTFGNDRDERIQMALDELVDRATTLTLDVINA